MRDYRTVSPFTNFIPPDIFVGRARELSEIESAFANGLRGVVIVGSAGVGKTSLARMFASRSEKQYPGGVFVASVSSAETAAHFLSRTLPRLSGNAYLLVMDDAEVLDQAGLQVLIDNLSEYPRLKVVLTSRKSIELPPDLFRSINLDEFSKDEIQELLKLRNAFAHGQLDESLVDRLFTVAGGNAALASIAIDAVRNGVAGSWEELFRYLRNFRTSGLVGPDGQSLPRESNGYQQIIVAVSSANSELLEILKKDPKLVWKLPPRKFEEIIADILTKQGYQVSLTPASGDGGFDMYAAKKEGLGGFLYLVECKRYVPPNKVGVEIVRALYGVVQTQRATAGAIVTTSFFTAGAEAFQREIQFQMHLHDYIVLQKWIASFPTYREY